MATTSGQPTPVPMGDAEKQLIEVLKGRGAREMMEMAHRCPECDELVLVCDNGVWLDATPVTPHHEDYDSPLAMGIIRLGGMRMAAGGALDGGSRHMCHNHQPMD